MTNAAKETKPKRRWLRFSLRSLLLFTAVLSIFFAWAGSILIRVFEQRSVVAKIQSLGGEFYFDYQLAGEEPPPGPKLIRLIIGDDVFAYVAAVSLNDGDRATDADLAILPKLARLKDVAVHGSNSASAVTGAARSTES